jgi:hypothetical protein
MAAFVSKEQSIPNASATKIVDSADFDRTVVFNGSGQMRIAFTSSSVTTGAVAGGLALSVSINAMQFVLPAHEELWVYQSSGNPATVSYLVTPIAR